MHAMRLCLVLLSAGLLIPWTAQEAQAQQFDEQGFRKLAPGVMIDIPADVHEDEKKSFHDLVGLLAKDPDLGERPWAKNIAKDVAIKRDVWALEFSFKPMRLIQVDVPNNKGVFDRKTIWYLVYKVRNPGTSPVKFVPRMLLYSQDTEKYYADRLIPVAIDNIRRREDPRRKLLNSVEMASQEIPPSAEGEDNSVWGVAMWEDIPPETDYFSVFVQGLSNAFQMKAAEEAGKWTYTRKTLQLNFWRPGDEFFEETAEIRYGSPDKVEYRWLYK